MDLATRFNANGVRLFHEGNAYDAFIMFEASLQVMLQTSGQTLDQLDPACFRSLALYDAVKVALMKDEQYRRQQQQQQQQQQNQLGSDSHVVIHDGRYVMVSGGGLWQSHLQHRPAQGSITGTTTEMHCSRHSNNTIDDDDDNNNRNNRTNDRDSFAVPRHRISPATDQDPFLFARVFSLSGHYHHDYYQFVVAIATSLFNMSVILQRGLVVSYTSQCLERALALYTFAGEMLWSSIGYNLLITNQPGGVALSTLYCAILNNTGYLLYQMGCYQWSRTFFERLYQFLELLGPVGSDQEQQERDAFQLNIVVLYQTISGAAAA